MLLWSTHVTEEHFPLFAEIKRAGFDGVELPIFEGAPEHFRTVGQAIRDNGLRATAVTVMPDAERNCASADPAMRAAGTSNISNGRSTVWRRRAARRFADRSTSRSASSPASRRPGPSAPTSRACTRRRPPTRRGTDIKLSVEPLNRFECYVLNTVADSADVVRAVSAPNYGLLYDTFHANIEEKDPVGVIAPNIAHINHVHFSENDRGTPGKGHVPWAATMKALKQGGYDGWCVIEAFGRALAGPGGRDAGLARLLPESRGGLSSSAARFLREQWAKA